MRLQRFPSGIVAAFCWRCKYGVFRRDKAGLYEWAFLHEKKHQRAEAQ